MLRTLVRPIARIEPLESRIAPASITYIDVDQNTVTITSNKGTVAHLQQVAILVNEGDGQELQELRLSDLPNVFQGANISIIKGTSEDTLFVNVGFINAFGVDIGKVTVDGDLGRILAGDSNSSSTAVKKLTVGSMGVQGLNTQGAGASLDSRVLGRLSSLNVLGDFKDASLTILGVDPDPDPLNSSGVDARGDLGNVFIGGNLVGGAADRSGYIYAKGDVGNVEVVGSLMGGSGDFSASITTERKMGKVEIGGDLRGGLTAGAAVSNFAGRIFSAGVMGSVKIDGSLLGGDGLQSGNVSSNKALGNVTIAGNVVGGAGFQSAAVGTGGDIGKISVGGNILGGTGGQSGSILSGGDMKSVKITGDVVGGTQLFSGTIASDGTIASVFVDGSITGGAGEQSGAIGSSKALGAVVIAGNINGGSGVSSGQVASANTIKSVEVQGSIIGGSNFQSGAIGCVGQLGPVTIGVNLQGGTGVKSGVILSGTGMSKVTINGSIIGGSEVNAGAIISVGDIQTVIVDGNIVGGGAPDSGVVSSEEKINKVTIGGNLQGGDGEGSGSIQATTNINKVDITGSILGDDGDFSGSVISAGNLGDINVGQDVVGGVGQFSGLIESDGDLELESGKISSVTIGGDLMGGNGNSSGLIFSSNTLDRVTITGNVVGGFGFGSAGISADGDLGPVEIGGSVMGNTSEGGAESAKIVTFGKLERLTIGGNLVGGNSDYDTSRDVLGPLGQVFAAESIGPVKIEGSILGGSGNLSAQIRGASIKSVVVGGDIMSVGSGSASIIAENGNIGTVDVTGAITTPVDVLVPFQISASGEIDSIMVGNLDGSEGSRGYITAGERIGKLTVVNSTSNFRIMAGYDTDLTPINSAASIGTVTIGTTGAGDYEATDIVAGIQPGFFGGPDGNGGSGQFGDSDDRPIVPFSSKSLSKIASVIIKGEVNDSFSQSSYGIVAGVISSVKVGGTSLDLGSGLDTIDLFGDSKTSDTVTVREIAFTELKG